MKVLVTGWAGFIGSNLVRQILQETDWEVVGMDSQTYAARPLWVYELTSKNKSFAKRFTEITHQACDIRRLGNCTNAVAWSNPDAVIHLAAESHVCRSIEGPGKFVETNIIGTYNMLEAVRNHKKNVKFHHVSTDEVYGEAEEGTRFVEEKRYEPRSPYSASKAASDHLVTAYHHTYGMDCRISNCSNNFGANQHEEKLIPKTILKTLKGEEVTLYGPGLQVRDWIWVDDHCRGIIASLLNSKPGGQHLFGGEKELTNVDVVSMVWEAVDQVGKEEGFTVPEKRLAYTNDRPTDDKRYAIDWTRANKELAWAPCPEAFFLRLKETVRWYRKHAL